jgi:tetratricopeptide (TPR) repeat protein
MQRDDLTRQQWSLPANRPFAHIAESISPEEIRKMASLGGLEKNEWLYLQLGLTFVRIKTRQHLISAVGEFEHVIELGKNRRWNWLAYLKKAEALSALGEFRDAIVAASSALNAIPEYCSGHKLSLLQTVQEANYNLGNLDAALKVAVEAWVSAPSDPRVTYDLICTAHRTGNYLETVRIMRSAIDCKDGARLLGHVIANSIPQRYVTAFMSIACAQIKDLDLARDVFNAIKSEASVYEVKGMAVADVALAQLYYGVYRDDEKAIALWEHIVQDYPNTRPAFEASSALMALYFSKAQSSGSTESRTWVSKMEQLAELIRPSDTPRTGTPCAQEHYNHQTTHYFQATISPSI